MSVEPEKRLRQEMPEGMPSREAYRQSIDRIARSTDRDVKVALASEKIGLDGLIALLSPAAAGYLDEMALRAKRLTEARFGRTVGLYAPLYVSNHCANRCRYCGFNAGNGIPRQTLSLEGVAAEADAIAGLGHRSILLVSGDSDLHSPLPYLIECVRILASRFRTIHVEIAAQSPEGYADLVAAGVEGVTIYQETYDKDLYAQCHPVGPKKDYSIRWQAPLAALRAGMRTATIGALLGLASFEADLYWGARHLLALRDADPSAELAFSFPRMRPHSGSQFSYRPVSDREIIQGMLAIRLFAPWAGISVSTRERASFRNALTGLVATRLSAASRTTVGGYANPAQEGTGQFDIDDSRSVQEIISMIASKGYTPVAAGWDHRFSQTEGKEKTA